jgi:large subunit ribosomal protein L10
LKPEKIKTVSEIKEKVENAKGIYMVDFTGMNTEMVNELRTMFRNSDIEYKVFKNTLMRIALKEMAINLEDEYLKLPTGMAFSYKDPFSPIKILNVFIKKYEKPIIKVSIIGGIVYNNKDTVKFSTIPSKEELIAKMLAGINSPIVGFVGVLNGILRNFVYLIYSIKEKKEKEEQ